MLLYSRRTQNTLRGLYGRMNGRVEKMRKKNKKEKATLPLEEQMLSFFGVRNTYCI